MMEVFRWGRGYIYILIYLTCLSKRFPWLDMENGYGEYGQRKAVFLRVV